MDNSAYQSRYGAWAGRPNGAAPDFSLCCEEVWPSQRGEMHHQCRKKRGHGPGEAYCKTHNPEAVKARKEAANEEYRVKTNKMRYSWNGRVFFNALQQIADGHNDARGLAQEVIAEFKKGEK